MWNTVLKICEDVGHEYSINLIDDIRNELSGRQYFHIYEMYAGSKHQIMKELRDELLNIGIKDGIYAKSFRIINVVMGEKARYFYKIMRKIYQ